MFFKKTALATIILLVLASAQVNAQNLDSSNYRILDPTTDSGGGASESSNYATIISVGNPTADARLTSGSYELKSGFPNGILASVPIAVCFETTTNSGTTDCIYFPNANGAQGECGVDGCYDRAKLEIDDQSNPIDTVYLVKIEDITNTVTYFLQSDHTLATNYDISDFLTQCQLEGRDADDTACDDSGDGNWDEDLQRYNILGLMNDTQYRASISALSGDFTGTRFSETLDATTVSPAITFDLDVAATDTESAGPYAVDLGELFNVSVTTATNRIWIDLSTNSVNGTNIYVRDISGALTSVLTGETVPSESEDLATDPGGNGGYGIKVASATQSALGPLQSSATYDTGGANQVGALSSTNAVLFFTDTTSTNNGPVTSARGSVYLKARSSAVDIAAADLTDQITFIAVANF